MESISIFILSIIILVETAIIFVLVKRPKPRVFSTIQNKVEQALSPKASIINDKDPLDEVEI